MEADRRLRLRRGEEVERELREGGDERERRGEEEAGEREGEIGEVAKRAVVEGLVEDADRMRHRRPQHAARRAADLAVAGVEARGPAVVEVRDDDPDGEAEPERTRRHDRRAGPRAAAGKRVPHPEAGDDERDLLLRRRREEREDRER